MAWETGNWTATNPYSKVVVITRPCGAKLMAAGNCGRVARIVKETIAKQGCICKGTEKFTIKPMQP